MRQTNLTALLIISLVAIVAAAALVVTYFARSPGGGTQPPSEWVTFPDPYMRMAYGPLNTTVTTWARFRDIYYNGDIMYEKGGVKHKGWYNSAFEDAITWVRGYTPKGTVILSWWDYGHMIVGLSGRSVIVANPSKEMLISVTNTSAAIELDPHEKLSDAAKVLTTTDSNVAKLIMQKYGAKYILVASGIFGDEEKAKWIFYASGVDLNKMDEYWQNGKIVNKGRDTLLYKMLNKMDIEGFKLSYSDENSRVYEALE